jgi:enterochelin esterase-like enzyme
MQRLVWVAIVVSVMGSAGVAMAQTPAAPLKDPMPPTPVRDPNAPGFVKAAELPDGAVPPAKVDGNFIIGPTHNRAPEFDVQENVPHGTLYEFTMSSADSKFYPGIARDAADPKDPTGKVVNTSHPAPYTRHVSVYVPKQYVPGMAAPFILGADGVDHAWPTVFDNMIAAHRLPVMIGVFIAPGGGDPHGSERGLEYDTMSGKYAEFVEAEVLPLVEKIYNVKLTKNPDGRATMGASSGGSAAMIMAWYHPELYHRVLTVSGTFVNQQWPHDDAVPHGAWELHEHLISNNPAKPLRIWMEVGDHDNYHPNAPDDYMHDWVVANENMAKVLTAKAYHYQFVFARNAGHTDRPTRAQLLPEALEYVWQGYPIAGAKN